MKCPDRSAPYTRQHTRWFFHLGVLSLCVLLPLLLAGTQDAQARSPAVAPGSGRVAIEPVIVLPKPKPMPTRPRLVVSEARLPIEVQQVRVDAEVVGRAARTRIEMTFRNPNERVLEGELQFPLRPGQSVAGFALDIDGELRPAVPVEKARGRQVFEDVIRTRVDPALLEVTEGNNYRLRVYPLPAGGTRRVVLEIVETLARSTEGGAARLDYQLPLQFGQAIGRLEVDLQFAAVDPGAIDARLGAQRMAAVGAADGSARVIVGVSAAHDPHLRVLLPVAGNRAQVSTGQAGSDTFFHAEVPVVAGSRARAGRARRLSACARPGRGAPGAGARCRGTLAAVRSFGW